MNFRNLPERDERTEAVEKASDSLAYRVLAFALLMDVAVRAYLRGEAAWDLLGLAIVSGLLGVSYQTRYKIHGPGWLRSVVLSVLLAVVVAIVMLILFHRVR